MKKYLIWARRGWPLFAMITLLGLHSSLLAVVDDTPSVNRFVGLAAQLFGFLLLFYSINQNLSLLRGTDAQREFMAWLGDFPLVSRNVSVVLSGVMAVGGVGKVRAFGHVSGGTVEERLARVEQQVNDLHRTVAEQGDRLMEELKAARRELERKLQEEGERVKDLASKVQQLSVGGVNLQVFGLALAAYGTVAGAWPAPA